MVPPWEAHSQSEQDYCVGARKPGLYKFLILVDTVLLHKFIIHANTQSIAVKPC